MFLKMLQQTFFGLRIGKPPSVVEVPTEQLVDGALEMVFMLVGGISLLVVVIQGIRYALSAGDLKKTNSARDGLIYAGVGSAIAFTAWSLVHFTLNRVLRASSNEADISTISILLVDIAGLLVFVGAIITIVMILVGAFKLLTSDGAPEKAGSARSTIIHALIGLIVCIAAGPILMFILERLSS